MAQSTSRGTAPLFAPDGEWNEYAPGTAYRCEIYLSREGTEFVAVASLPGVSGRGDSELAALESAKKTAAEAIRAYKAAAQKIPWHQRGLQTGEVLRVVIVAI